MKNQIENVMIGMIDEDEEYEILKDGYIDELFDDMIKRNGL